MTLADAAAYHFVWTAFQALLPVALAAFLGGIVIAWLVWGLRGGKRD